MIRYTEKQIKSQLLIMTVCFFLIGTLVLISGCSDPVYFKFDIGEIVQTKLDGTKGQILRQWAHRKQYTVRFSRSAKFESRTMHEFELEKVSD